jgi:hypothetical protein
MTREVKVDVLLIRVVKGLGEDATALVKVGEHLVFGHLEIAKEVREATMWTRGPCLAAYSGGQRLSRLDITVEPRTLAPEV